MTESEGVFDLLQATGRDCVGAVHLLGDDEEPKEVQQISGTPLSESDIEQLFIKSTRRTPMGNLEDQEELGISLADAQEKTALLRHNGQWIRPLGSTLAAR